MKGFDCSNERYKKMTNEFLSVLKSNGPWNWKFEKNSFPWDDFCGANERARELTKQFLIKHRYELSERQCSVAVQVLMSMEVKG